MSLRVKRRLPTVSRKPLAQRTLKREQRRRSVRRMMLASACLIIMAIGGGMIYTWVMGQNEPALARSDVKPNSKQVNLTPPKVSTTAPVGVAIQSVTSPVSPGENASVSVRTNPEVECSIVVTYDDTAAVDSGLVKKKADEFGTASWAWTVAQGVPLGTWPVDVTCQNKKHSAVLKVDLVIK
jgi:hypothetical protein